MDKTNWTFEHSWQPFGPRFADDDTLEMVKVNKLLDSKVQDQKYCFSCSMIFPCNGIICGGFRIYSDIYVLYFLTKLVHFRLNLKL